MFNFIENVFFLCVLIKASDRDNENRLMDALVAETTAVYIQADGNKVVNNNRVDKGKLECRNKKKGLDPKIHTIDTTWQLNFKNVDAVTTVWHRDILAAKCILYKDMYLCTKTFLNRSLHCVRNRNPCDIIKSSCKFKDNL